MFEVHHEVAGLERAKAFERGARAVAARAAQAPVAPEDLVVGEDAHHVGHHEAATEHADGERCGHRPVLAEQFLEALRLPRVVAQDDCMQPVALQPA